jgi:hypothetical protein
MPKLKEMLFGKKDKIKNVSTLDPNQQELMKLVMQGLKEGKGPFAELFGDFDKDSFDEGVSKPMMKQFQEETLPQIQEKFIAGNQVLGSGMRRGQMKAANDFQSELAKLMYGAQKDQQSNKLAGINSMLGKTTNENVYKQGTTGAVQGLAQGASQAFANSVMG